MKKRIIVALAGLVILIARFRLRQGPADRYDDQSGQEVRTSFRNRSLHYSRSRYLATAPTALGTLNAVKCVTVGVSWLAKVVKIVFESGTPVEKGKITFAAGHPLEGAQLPDAGVPVPWRQLRNS